MKLISLVGSYLKMSPAQCKELIDRHHIYLPSNGRINVSGLNKSNIEFVADAINKVVSLANGVTKQDIPAATLKSDIFGVLRL